jgi:phosphohistidine swiveling domain-containing protein
MSTSHDGLRWDPPGPGPWEAESAHFPKPLPRFGRRVIAGAFREGFTWGSARYGLLLSHFEVGFVNDFWYQQAVAFGAPKGAKGPPPAPILWLLTRLHPALRKRIQTGHDALEGCIWHEDLRRWDEVDKPRATARHKQMLAIDPTSLDDGALLRYLGECERHVGDMILLHHRYTIPCIVPTGDFLAQVSGWTGRPAGEILLLLRGSTQISLGFSSAELDELAAAMRDDDAAAALLHRGGDAGQILSELRRIPGRTGDAARRFLDLVWHRALSYDVSEKATGEMPEVLVGAIRAALTGQHKPRSDDAASKHSALRAQVPDAHKAEFDRLLREARALNRLRDERGLYADCWAIGIARRALLELGRRLVRNGKLNDPSQAVHLDLDEATSLLGGGSQPSLAEVQRRARWRAEKSASDAPAWLGSPPSAPPDPKLLPVRARRAARAVDAVLSNLFKESSSASTHDTVRGMSVNEGSYEGIARVVNDASEFGRLQQGDVLVTRSTAPYFNVVLPLLGALVTDRGGQLCHAAIVAREYGIPGVVGTSDATQRIPDGARVLVDGTKGEVRIVSR